MAYSACSFIFDGIPSEQYGLMIYTINDTGQDDTVNAGPNTSISEDRLSRRYDSIHYGTHLDDALEFTIVFGSLEPLDRYDVAVINSWLFGHKQYKWLDMIQPDMRGTRFKCILTEPEVITVADLAYAWSCKVVCNAPYAFAYPEYYSMITAPEGGRTLITNYSSHNGYYYPVIDLEVGDMSTFSVVNESDDKDREFTISGLSGGQVVHIDCLNQVITASDGANLYNTCNFKFPRLIRGDNMIVVRTDGTVTFTCEYPIAVGG